MSDNAGQPALLRCPTDPIGKESLHRSGRREHCRDLRRYRSAQFALRSQKDIGPYSRSYLNIHFCPLTRSPNCILQDPARPAYRPNLPTREALLVIWGSY